MGSISNSFPYEIGQDDGRQEVNTQNDGQSPDPEVFDQHALIVKIVTVKRNKHQNGQGLKRERSDGQN